MAVASVDNTVYTKLNQAQPPRIELGFEIGLINFQCKIPIVRLPLSQNKIKISILADIKPRRAPNMYLHFKQISWNSPFV